MKSFSGSIDATTAEQLMLKMNHVAGVTIEGWEAFAILTLMKRFPEGNILLADAGKTIEAAWIGGAFTVSYS